jgi:hypothetical protein
LTVGRLGGWLTVGRLGVGQSVASGVSGIPYAADGALTPPVEGQRSLATKTDDSTEGAWDRHPAGGTGVPRIVRWQPNPRTGSERALTPPLREHPVPLRSLHCSDDLHADEHQNRRGVIASQKGPVLIP